LTAVTLLYFSFYTVVHDQAGTLSTVPWITVNVALETPSSISRNMQQLHKSAYCCVIQRFPHAKWPAARLTTTLSGVENAKEI